MKSSHRIGALPGAKYQCLTTREQHAGGTLVGERTLPHSGAGL